MLKGIDHLVVVVPELEAAVASYRGLDFTVVPGGLHPIGPVGLPATANTILHPLRGIPMALGGTPAGNAAAADSWPRVLQFLRTTLPTR